MALNFNDIKEKVKETLDIVADTTRDVASKTADKAKNVSRIAKLSLEISGEKDTIKKAYAEIGKLYYETHKDAPDGFFVQLCDEITLANKSIIDKETEIAELKADGNLEDDIEVEFEEIVTEAETEAEGECDCGCGEHTHDDAPAEDSAE
jgi:hypothetical protein